MPLLDERTCGVLLPIFSLPSGNLDGADEFVAFLEQSGARVWQVLPVGPPHADGSPYLALSTHAANPALIGLAELSGEDQGRRGLREIYKERASRDLQTREFEVFVETHRFWLEDYALFQAIRRQQHGVAWYLWPEELKHRHEGVLQHARIDLAEDIGFERWLQFQFDRQWTKLRSRCASAGIELYGDLPLYVSHDSVDVWQYPELFKLNPDCSASSVAGVPPDYFSATGQRWGNPIYDWEKHAETRFEWWIQRMRAHAALYDIVRIDHFRGLEAYWQIPGEAETAETGEWRPGPGADLLQTLFDTIAGLQLVAEDLGTITPGVDQLRSQFGLPGIRVLHFGFDGSPDNPHAPSNIQSGCVLYTGTHDNDTSVGWYESLGDDERARVDACLTQYRGEFPDTLLECAFDSVANTVVIPIQDLLGLDTSCRVNTPGTVEGNWRWRLDAGWPEDEAAKKLAALATRYDRLP